ncbi:hypothetical protein BD413DRAFT_204797 [Trametes elegans]|nr:hypothetical protein BD413DRAFT_204797 [Trametes elegans]
MTDEVHFAGKLCKEVVPCLSLVRHTPVCPRSCRPSPACTLSQSDQLYKVQFGLGNGGPMAIVRRPVPIWRHRTHPASLTTYLDDIQLMINVMSLMARGRAAACAATNGPHPRFSGPAEREGARSRAQERREACVVCDRCAGIIMLAVRPLRAGIL